MYKSDVKSPKYNESTTETLKLNICPPTGICFIDDVKGR